MKKWQGILGIIGDQQAVLDARAYRDAAIADGWTCEPTYKNEPMDQAARLHKDGFVIQILARPKTEKLRGSANVNIWGSDGLNIIPPDEYDWSAIVASLRYCGACGATDVDTTRYSFAGRCCLNCLPEMKRQYEKPGWCD